MAERGGSDLGQILALSPGCRAFAVRARLLLKAAALRFLLFLGGVSEK